MYAEGGAFVGPVPITTILPTVNGHTVSFPTISLDSVTAYSDGADVAFQNLVSNYNAPLNFIHSEILNFTLWSQKTPVSLTSKRMTRRPVT